MLSIASESNCNEFYTRNDALRNGGLVDVSLVASQEGFAVNVAMTPTVLQLLVPSTEEMYHGEDLWGRVRQLFALMRLTLSRKAHLELSRMDFPVNSFSTYKSSSVLRALFHRDEQGYPVITILHADEEATYLDNKICGKAEGWS